MQAANFVPPLTRASDKVGRNERFPAATERAATTPDSDGFVAADHTNRTRSGIVQQEWAPGLLCLALDIISWVILYASVTYFRGGNQHPSPAEWLTLVTIGLITIIISLWIVGGYHSHTASQTLSYSAEHLLALIAAAAFTSLLIYSAASYDQTMKPSRGVLLTSFLAFAPLSLSYRRLVNHYVSDATAHRAFLVIGSGELAASFYRAYRNSPNRQRLEFVGLEPDRLGDHICGPESPIIEGDLNTKLDRLDGNYSGVILAERVDRICPDLLQRLVRTQFQATRVYTLESFYEAQWKHVPVHSLDPFWPLQMGFQLARMSPYHYLKRIFDIILAGVALAASGPLIVMLTFAIWCLNGRPALFRQPRVGREGEVFTILKFRTMGAGSTDPGQDIYTREGDPRITSLGRWLRKLRLDELPQLWNVLRGEMSLIGPRAEWTKCAERYEKNIPFYHFRHLVKPGITGWAQVNYPYGESDEDALEKLKYDLYYIRHYSMKLDAMIVLKTVHTMLFGRGR